MPEFPDEKRFREWLELHDEKDIIAIGWLACTCPLALWLRAEGLPAPYVYPAARASRSTWYDDHHNGAGQVLPQWANRFALSIDRIAKLGKYNFGPVRKADCLRALQQR